MNSSSGKLSEERFSAAAARVMDRCDVLANFSEENGALTRRFCSPPMKQVHKEIGRWLEAIGWASKIDAAGNLLGNNSKVDRPAVLIGSHLDTVRNAGKYDGVLGVMIGLAIAELIRESKTELAFDVEIIGFSEEEGVRFNSPYIGSSAIVECFDSRVLGLKDENGISVKMALESFDCNPTEIGNASLANRNIIGFIEAHIEQGPVLEMENCPVGTVSAIAGQTRATLGFEGKAGHAGTIPHVHRRDALAGAAEFISAVEKKGRETDGLFATVGDVRVEPNISNVIPASAIVRVDLRHESDTVRMMAWQELKELASQIAGRRGLKLTLETNLNQPAIQMDQEITNYFLESISASGHEPIQMPSGAGHDAAMMARMVPTSMLFVRCRDGISHHPDEHVEEADVVAAIKILFRGLVRISNGLLKSRT